jgi:hypothetical protein
MVTLIISLLLLLWLTTALGVVGLCRLAQRGDAVQRPRAVPAAPRRQRLPRLRSAHPRERVLARRAR